MTFRGRSSTAQSALPKIYPVRVDDSILVCFFQKSGLFLNTSVWCKISVRNRKMFSGSGSTLRDVNLKVPYLTHFEAITLRMENKIIEKDQDHWGDGHKINFVLLFLIDAPFSSKTNYTIRYFATPPQKQNEFSDAFDHRFFKETSEVWDWGVKRRHV